MGRKLTGEGKYRSLKRKAGGDHRKEKIIRLRGGGIIEKVLLGKKGEDCPP